MRNVAVLLNKILAPKTKYNLGKISAKIDEGRYVVQDTITNQLQTVNGSATVGEYIVHEKTKILTNLGKVDIIVANV